MSTNRLIITGGPETGKTEHYGKKIAAAGIPTRSTDDLLTDPIILALPERERWSAMSAAIAATWFDIVGPWCIEGTAAPRALRKWLEAHPTGKPCDNLVWLTKVFQKRTPGQESMTVGMLKVMREIVPELRKRGVGITGWTD